MKYFLTLKDNSKIEVFLGQDVAEILEIEKWSPVIPTCMGGEVCNIGSENTINYDIENLKKYPDVIKAGTQVAVTEKLHGTFTMFGYVPGLENENLIEGNKFAASKGLGSKGLVFKNNEKNANNTYLKSFNRLTKFDQTIFEQLEIKLSETVGEEPSALANIFEGHADLYPNSGLVQLQTPIYFLGETYGKGVQDLTYGLSDSHFRLFDIYLGKPTQGRYLNVAEKLVIAEALGIETVPFLYVGPFDREKMNELAKGPTTIGAAHIREGIVIVPTVEERNSEIGRTMLKHINEAYLVRGGDETEFQ